MSSANIALFIDEHLKKLMNPQGSTINLLRNLLEKITSKGNVVLNIVKIDDDKTKHITFRYLKGRNKVRFPPQVGAKGNPVLCYSLREMLGICKD